MQHSGKSADTRSTFDARMERELELYKQVLRASRYKSLIVVAMAAVELLQEKYGFRITQSWLITRSGSVARALDKTGCGAAGADARFGMATPGCVGNTKPSRSEFWPLEGSCTRTPKHSWEPGDLVVDRPMRNSPCDSCGVDKEPNLLVAADLGDGAFLKVLCDACWHRLQYRAELRRRLNSKPVDRRHDELRDRW